ncbi:MAG: M35 family metallo-endopeptidase [Rubrivivax sp.]
MKKFSEAYEQATQALGEDKFAGEVAKLRDDLRALLAAGGPDAAKCEFLNKLRHTLKTASWKAISAGKGVGPEAARVQAVIEAAGADAGKPRRAATVKMLRHFYLTKSAGGQAVWVYSPPMAYTKWIFDEVSGADDKMLADVLGKPEDEVYTEKQRETMSDALQAARKVCLDVVTKVGTPDNATLNVVRRYFGSASTSTDDLKAVAATLRAGYQKIANACNASCIVISDEPIDRNSGGWSDWAFIYTTESMRVIYLQDAWLQKAGEVTPSNQSPLFRCARTIVHELSHKELSTEDVVYGPKGLQVEGSSALTADYALHNADSWAYFSMDVTGNLTGPDATNGTTPCREIRAVPSRVLTTV